MAVDHVQAIAGYKVGANAGDPVCQFQVGTMNFRGFGVDVNYEDAWAWFEKSAAQEYADAVQMLGSMYYIGRGVTSSFHHGREYLNRAIELGSTKAGVSLDQLTEMIHEVTRRASRAVQSKHSTLPIIARA